MYIVCAYLTDKEEYLEFVVLVMYIIISLNSSNPKSKENLKTVQHMIRLDL